MITKEKAIIETKNILKNNLKNFIERAIKVDLML
jgi:hypothetical protein